jgi:hypothetical protein
MGKHSQKPQWAIELERKFYQLEQDMHEDRVRHVKERGEDRGRYVEEMKEMYDIMNNNIKKLLNEIREFKQSLA